MVIIVFRMDIIYGKPMTYAEVARAVSGKPVVVGAKQLRKALLSGAAQCVYLAIDADPVITEPFARMCQLYAVAVFWTTSMAELGRACGIDVGASVAATVKSI